MKLKKLAGFGHLMVAVGVFLGRSAQADTTLDFNSFPDGQANNSLISAGFGSNASGSSAGVTVNGTGTPDIALTWGFTAIAGGSGGGGDNIEWDYYVDSTWNSAQLNNSAVGNTHTLTFTPSGGNAVIIKSFSFFGYYFSNERFTYNWSVNAGATVLTNGTTTFLSSSIAFPTLDIGFTNQYADQAVTLNLTRIASTLNDGESEGSAFNIAVDDILFDQVPGIPAPVPPTIDFGGRTWDILKQTAGAQYSPAQTNEYSTLDANTGLMTGRFGINSAMTTPVSLVVGDKVSYDYQLSELSRDLGDDGSFSSYVGASRTGFQDGLGNWVSGRIMTSISRWEQDLEGNIPASVFHERTGNGTGIMHVEWLFESDTRATVTLTIQGEDAPYATWTDTFTSIANIHTFSVSLDDSEQDVTLANFNVTFIPPSPTPPGTDEYQTYILRDHPLAYFRMNEPEIAGTGTAVNSGSLGTAGDAAYTGLVGYPEVGGIAYSPDTAAGFDGSSGGATVPYNAAVNPQGPFTVELWVKPRAIPDSGGTPCPISSAENFPGDRSGWQIRERDTGYEFVLYNHAGSGTAVNILGGGVPSTAGWTHLVGVYDGANAYLYVNGALASSASAAGFVANNNENGTGVLTVGKRSSLDNWFNGYVDEVAIYPGALSAETIASHYANGASIVAPDDDYQSLVLAGEPLEYLRLDEEAQTATNSGSLGALADGTYSAIGTAGHGVTGPLPPDFNGFEGTNNHAVAFNGSNSRIYLGNPAELNISNQITLEAWIKLADSQLSDTADIVAHGGNAGDNREVYLRFINGNTYQAGPWDGVNGPHVDIVRPSADVGHWVHLVATYNGTQWDLYRNGVAAAPTVTTNGPVAVNDAGWAIGASGDPYAINGFRGFNGGIDEVAIYNYALSSGQILSHYAAGTNGPLLTLSPDGSNVTITWPVGTLQEADDVTGPYTAVVAASPLTISASEAKKFYRVKL